jgi:hypothetical protein
LASIFIFGFCVESIRILLRQKDMGLTNNVYRHTVQKKNRTIAMVSYWIVKIEADFSTFFWLFATSLLLLHP